jgi:hypothetical protein
MQAIETYIVLGTIVWVWTELIMPTLFRRKTDLGYVYRNNLFMWLDREPINCGSCLAFWVGVIAFIVTVKLFFLTLPLLYKLIHKYL